jgi:hypothetical protein
MSGYASTADLASIRAEMDGGLPDSAVIKTVTRVNTANGYTETQTVRTSDVPCRYATLTGRELIRAQQLAEDAESTVTFGANTDVRGTDVVVVTNLETAESFELEVLHVIRRSREFSRQVLTKLLLS